MSRFLLIAVVSYLVGSIPFGFLLIRIFRREDIRHSGSGNIGATNVSRKSPALGILTLLLDALKGAFAVLLAMGLDPAAFSRNSIEWRFSLPAWSSAGFVQWAALAALFAVLGHMFPVWLKFHGGKGVATGLGAFVMISPEAVLIAMAVFVAVVFVFGFVSLGSIISVTMFPLIAWMVGDYGTWPALVFMAVSSLAIVVRHHENIRRLLAGTESSIRSKQRSDRSNDRSNK
jgi:acyl phosphate:glycerol-3-phosphate acyltransferase